MVKKRVSRGILEFCRFCDHARSGFAREVRLETKKVHFMVKKAECKNGVGRYLGLKREPL